MPMVSVLQIVCGIVLSFLYAGMVLLSMVVDAKVVLPESVMADGSNCVFSVCATMRVNVKYP